MIKVRDDNGLGLVGPASAYPLLGLQQKKIHSLPVRYPLKRYPQNS